jgi:hypothetical protein
MNKRRKGFLNAASILTIVASAFGILYGFMFMFIGSSLITEDLIVEVFKEDQEYTHVELADGSYYFTYVEDGIEGKITEEQIELVISLFSTCISVGGLIGLGLSIAKLVLAIRILNKNSKEEYAKGNTIALLVLSVLGCNLLETAFLIVAMCIKDQPTENNEQKDVVTVSVDDI